MIKKHLEMRKNFLAEEKKEREKKTKKKLDDVYKNLNEFKNLEEKKRLILENETFEKSKKNFMIFYLITYSEKN